MNSLRDCYTLNNGVKIPCIGFGTWEAADGDTCVNAVREALAAGYRHIDTAERYENEASVGRAIAQSGIPRDELFITTKLQNTAHGYDATLAAFNASMEKLRLHVLDLYLIHWPNPLMFRDRWQQANADSWRAMEELLAAGRVRAIGVSNFMPRHLDALLQTAKVIPAVNQIHLCPGDTQDDVTACCRRHNILPEAYSPLGRGAILDVPALQALAAKYNKTIPQLCLRWSLQMGFLPLPKSVTPARIRANADVFGFQLTPDDMQTIRALPPCCGTQRDPDTITF